MIGVAIASVMLAGVMGLGPALGEVVQHRSFETSRHARHRGKVAVVPYAPVPALPAATPRLIPDRATAPAAPFASVPPPPPAAQFVPHNGSVVVVPPALAPGPGTYSDRASRCIQAGAAAGVGANQLGEFTMRCAQ
jgi:hypothetical protein